MNNSLLPPNSTETERVLERVMQRASQLAVPLRELWNPDTCPTHLLPWLAWSLSLDNWQPYWPEAVKRERIRTAIDIQRRKGTVQSVRDVVRSFGASLSLREWWQQTPAAEPHTFSVVLTLGRGAPNTIEYQNDIISELNRTKPVRSHYSLTLGLSAAGALGLAGAARPITYRRIQCTEAP